MPQFNLDDYETVKERKKRFYKDHPDGRIIVELINKTTILEYALVRAILYIDKSDEFPKSIGYAMELRDMELSVSSKGKEYASVNYTSWLENAEESAVGRVLDNAGYAGNDKCSREEMEKVERISNKVDVGNPKGGAKLDFMDVEAHLANLNIAEDVLKYKKELWVKHPKMSEKQIGALQRIFETRETQIKSMDKEVKNTI